jgi:ubiquinone/menaquinone biosynthesis C-methylase UbiE
MSFDVAASAYDRFMGRYSTLLSPQLCDLAGVEPGLRVIDVGCGPGALTAELAARLGGDAVVAVDPSEPFVAAARERFPDVDVRRATAEELPFEDGAFDVALAQLVVHFMTDPLAGIREMARVTRAGGVVAACVWDHGGGSGPLSAFWAAARDLYPRATDESRLTGSNRGELAALFETAGLREVEETALEVTVDHPTFEEWWEPYTFGVGPAGAFVAALDEDARVELREHCRAALPDAPFSLSARAWTARGLAG